MKLHRHWSSDWLSVLLPIPIGFSPQSSPVQYRLYSEALFNYTDVNSDASQDRTFYSRTVFINRISQSFCIKSPWQLDLCIYLYSLTGTFPVNTSLPAFVHLSPLNWQEQDLRQSNHVSLVYWRWPMSVIWLKVKSSQLFHRFSDFFPVDVASTHGNSSISYSSSYSAWAFIVSGVYMEEDSKLPLNGNYFQLIFHIMCLVNNRANNEE